MKKILKWFIGIFCFLFIAGIIAVVVFVNQFDLNEYKSEIEKIVFEQTGRQLHLNGDVDLKISLIPTVAVKDMTFENASWAKEKNMVSIKEADISLAILPLIHKKIEIGQVNIIEPVILLEVNEDGQENWVFEKPNKEEKTEGEAKDENSATEEINGAAAPMLAGFFAEHVNIKKGILIFEDKKSNSKMSLNIKDFEMSSKDDDDEIKFVYDIVFNEQDIKGSATGSSVNTLLENKPYHVTLNTKAYGATLKADAILTDLMGNLAFDGTVDVQSPQGNFGLPKTSVLTKVSGNTALIKADIEKLDIAGNVIRSKMTVDLSGKKPSINGNIQSALIDLARFSKPQKSAKLQLISSAHAASFVPNENLDLSVLNSVNANVVLDIAKLLVNEDIALENIKGTINVSNGVLNIKPFTATAGGGAITGDVSLNSKGNETNVNLNGKNIIIQDFIKSLHSSNEANFGFLSGGQTNLNINLKTSGKTYPKLVENLDGQVLLVVGESKLHAGAMKYLRGNFISHVLSALNLQAKDPKMSLQCAVLRADMKNGVADFPKGIVFNSKKIVVVGDGNVNLKNDKIDIAIKPFNGNLTDTNIAQALSSLVKISGTVSDPGIAIDTASVVKNVVGVAMTGPVFLGSQLLLDADPAPCYTALKETIYADMFEAPKGVKAGVQNVYQGASDTISDGVNLITGTAGNVVQGGADIIGGTAKGVFNLLTGGSKKKKE